MIEQAGAPQAGLVVGSRAVRSHDPSGAEPVRGREIGQLLGDHGRRSI
jgi:hypothetical protein